MKPHVALCTGSDTGAPSSSLGAAGPPAPPRLAPPARPAGPGATPPRSRPLPRKRPRTERPNKELTGVSPFTVNQVAVTRAHTRVRHTPINLGTHARVHARTHTRTHTAVRGKLGLTSQGCQATSRCGSEDFPLQRKHCVCVCVVYVVSVVRIVSLGFNLFFLPKAGCGFERLVCFFCSLKSLSVQYYS